MTNFIARMNSDCAKKIPVYFELLHLL